MPGKRVCNKKGRQRKVPARSRKTQLRAIMKRIAFRRRMAAAARRAEMHDEVRRRFTFGEDS